MNRKVAQSFLIAIPLFTTLAFATEMERPKSGKVEIMKLSDVKPGMKAVAWTVFSGKVPEAVPV